MRGGNLLGITKGAAEPGLSVGVATGRGGEGVLSV